MVADKNRLFLEILELKQQLESWNSKSEEAEAEITTPPKENHLVFILVLGQFFINRDIKSIAAFASTCTFWRNELTGFNPRELNQKQDILKQALFHCDSQLDNFQPQFQRAYENYNRENAAQFGNLEKLESEIATIKVALPRIILDRQITREHKDLLQNHKNIFSKDVWQNIQKTFCYHIRVIESEEAGLQTSAPKFM